MSFSNLAFECNDYMSSCTNKIRTAVSDIASSYLYIGFLLYECDYYKYYELGGFDNIIQYGQSELGFKKSTIYNFINVFKKFGQVDGDFPNYQIIHKYKEFSFSQLCEMLSLSDSLLSKVSSDMTIRDIRDLKTDVSRRLENEKQEASSIMNFSNNDISNNLSGFIQFDYDNYQSQEFIDFLKNQIVKLQNKGYKVCLGYYK